MGKYTKVNIPTTDMRAWVLAEFDELYQDMSRYHETLDAIHIHNTFKEVHEDKYTLTFEELKLILDALAKAPMSGLVKAKKGEYRMEM